MPSVRIGLITTLDRNIGDDFIRDGIVQILTRVHEGTDIRLAAVNKHTPLSVYGRWHPIRWTQSLDRLPRGRRAAETVKAKVSRALHRLGGSRFERADMIVQCGAPVMWPGCHRSEWAVPLWDQVVGRLSDRITVLNLAAGSAYPWEAQPETVSDRRDADFLRRIFGYCRLTTARDDLAARLGRGLGTSLPLIPCSAFLTGRRFQAPWPDDDGLVLFNYMPGGGHYDWSQGIDAKDWETTAGSLIDRLASRHRMAFLCHDEKERAAAASLRPDVPRFLPASIEDYFALAAASKAAVCNRLHAAVGLAGIGIPSVSIGTDTRMLMVAAIGLPYRYVKDVSAEGLEEDFETVVQGRKEERERLLEFRESTWDRYVEEVTQAMSA